MDSEVSVGLVVRNKNLLMFFDDDNEEWNVPNTSCESGELAADAAERVVEDMTGCTATVSRYRGKIKKRKDHEGGELTVQPYSIDMDGEPENGQWVPVSDLDDKNLAHPVEHISEEINGRL